jgi:hypothetical protein
MEAIPAREKAEAGRSRTLEDYSCCRSLLPVVPHDPINV